MPNQEVATFTDRYGDERVVHRTRSGLKVKQQSQTPILRLNQEISGLVGARVRTLREKAGYTLEELCVRAGLRTVSPKQRMWEIENSLRGEGVRLGTLYALALALEVEVEELLPTVKEVAAAAGARTVAVPELRVG